MRTNNLVWGALCASLIYFCIIQHYSIESLHLKIGALQYKSSMLAEENEAFTDCVFSERLMHGRQEIVDCFHERAPD